MKAIKESTMDAYEDVALKGIKEIEKFFTYQGENKNYFQKARVGAITMSAFSRLRASEANRIALEQAAKRGK